MVNKTSIHPRLDRRLIRQSGYNFTHTKNRKDQSSSGLSQHKHNKNTIVVRSLLQGSTSRSDSEEADDVIDLGAPRCVRAACPADSRTPARARVAYTPNPRLYPGRAPRARREPKQQQVQVSVRRRRKGAFRRVVPNSRLYRPAPPRPSPPPARPRASWPPPAPSRTLDTASRAALHVQLSRHPSQPCQPPQHHQPHLVVRLPGGAAAMSAAHRAPPTPTPEDRSDGNDASSAPSEFLAEFLSAIMRREYAEALKYCQLILHYEPHNATARGFHPLLELKVKATQEAGSSSSSARGCVGGDSAHSSHSSLASQSSLELDSSDQSEPSDSPPRTTDGSAGSTGWVSGSASASPDDNGNMRQLHADRDDTDENDNAAGDISTHATHAAQATHSTPAAAHSAPAANKTSEGSARAGAGASLRRLRAHFAAAR